ncbi:CBPA5 Carboxypeptidase, partial [Brachypteracias leptosomus]|nr:CBPA5 Carboxypeptidase [Brachypteracias leptosomus]
DQVLRIMASNEEELTLLRVLGERPELQLDFWRHPSSPVHPVDVRVPFPSLQPVKVFLESNNISYSIMIKDVQELLDEEKRTMVKTRRVQRNINTFDFASYHAIDEV